MKKEVQSIGIDVKSMLNSLYGSGINEPSITAKYNIVMSSKLITHLVMQGEFCSLCKFNVNNKCKRGIKSINCLKLNKFAQHIMDVTEEYFINEKNTETKSTT